MPLAGRAERAENFKSDSGGDPEPESQFSTLAREMSSLLIESRFFGSDGDTVNNEDLPLVLMRGTEAAHSDAPAEWFEERFAANGWGGSWRWRIYPFHHFHTNTHEVLGVSQGGAELLLGGSGGERFQVGVGDVVVIPAGVGHKCESCSAEFEVVGAYPSAVAPDLFRSGEGEVGSLRGAVSRVGLPAMDPVFGAGGPLFDHWK